MLVAFLEMRVESGTGIGRLFLFNKGTGNSFYLFLPMLKKDSGISGITALTKGISLTRSL